MKRLTIPGTALSLGLFFDVTFALCALWGLVVPAAWEPMARIWEAVFPGFTWLTPQSFLLGLVEAFLYGWYVALVFVPLFNHFESQRPAEVGAPTMGLPGEAAHHP
ncbi:MAG: hypothetical protein HYV61_08115 [Candidatus Rokubacteria bacterium]|nr:hypothetical protein [Candidatus Rokubacteria bacterium]